MLAPAEIAAWVENAIPASAVRPISTLLIWAALCTLAFSLSEALRYARAVEMVTHFTLTKELLLIDVSTDEAASDQDGATVRNGWPTPLSIVVDVLASFMSSLLVAVIFAAASVVGLTSFRDMIESSLSFNGTVAIKTMAYGLIALTFLYTLQYLMLAARIMICKEGDKGILQTNWYYSIFGLVVVLLSTIVWIITLLARALALPLAAWYRRKNLKLEPGGMTVGEAMQMARQAGIRFDNDTSVLVREIYPGEMLSLKERLDILKERFDIWDAKQALDAFAFDLYWLWPLLKRQSRQR